MEPRSQIHPDIHKNAPTTWDERLTKTLKNGMKEVMFQFEGTSPVMRPVIPKINTSRRMARILDTMNREVLPEEVAIAQDLETPFCHLLCCNNSG